MPLFLNLDWLFDGLALSRVLSGVMPIGPVSLAGPASPQSLFDNVPMVTTSPPPSAPVLPNFSIDWGNLFAVDLTAQFNAIAATVNSTVNSFVTEYTDLFSDLSQLIGTLPELNFANFLTIDLGNIFSDSAYNQLLVFGNSLLDTGNLSKALGDLETFLGVDIVPGNGLPTNAGLVQGVLSLGGLGAAIEPFLAELTANPFVANFLTPSGQSVLR
jgi:hypothetical protein